uniref:Armadillo repeat-containing protein 1 n=1 Tax=Haemonchus contortus TaxID=6289 RepID=A0A7I4Y049_HAECO
RFEERELKLDMGDSDQEKVVSTLKAYLKLCAKPPHRPLILKDQTILHVLKNFLEDDRVVVMTYLVKILLYLSENPDDALVLSNVEGLEEKLSAATEKSFPPNIVYNILIIISRLKSAQAKVARNRKEQNDPVPASAGDSCVGGGGNTNRKFVSRKSKQLIYEFDELWEDLKNEIERRVLAKRGVISIYFNTSSNRATIRTVLTVDANEITDLLFDCGCEMVTQVVKVDGVDELFKMYASEREKKVVKLPEYLDDLEVIDPKSCVVTNDYASAQKDGGGWFSTLSSFVKSSLW